jgi:hypothetical protein
MNENENNFDALRQLLKLKRHETPPPGYFDNFSSQVIVGIRAGKTQASRTADERYFSEAPWLLKFLQLFELKPAFAGAFASALVLLLAFGIVYSDRPDATSQPILQNSEPSAVSFAAVTPSAVPPPADNTGLMVSTNPATSLQPVASLFGSQNPFAQPVSFSPSGQ